MRIEIVDKNNAVTTPMHVGVDLSMRRLVQDTGCEHEFEDTPATKTEHGLRITMQHCRKCNGSYRTRLQTIDKADDIAELIATMEAYEPGDER